MDVATVIDSLVRLLLDTADALVGLVEDRARRTGGSER